MKKRWIALALIMAVLVTAWLCAVDIFALERTPDEAALLQPEAALETEQPVQETPPLSEEGGDAPSDADGGHAAVRQRGERTAIRQ